MPSPSPQAQPDRAHPRRTKDPTSLVVGLVVVLLAVRALAVVLILRDSADHPLSILGGDARRYMEILSSPGTPYRDFAVEYPPLTLAFTWLIQGGDLFATQVRLAVSQVLVELAVAGVLAWAWGRKVALAFLVLGTPMVLYPFAYFRVDLLSVLGAVAAMALVRRHKPAWGGAALALASFAKVWPLALVPWLAIGQGWRRRGTWRAVAGLGTVLLAGTTAWAAWAGIDGPAQVLSFRGANGWQIESVVGIFVHMADPAATAVEQGAWRTAAAVPGAVRVALPAIAVGAALGAWALGELGRRRHGDGASTLLDGWATLAAVLSMLVFSTIISPQYLLWLTPFVAIVLVGSWTGPERASGWLASALFVVAGALSAVELAFIHRLTSGVPWAMWVVVVRNAALVAMLAVCFLQLASAARPATRREPAPSPGPMGPSPHPTPAAQQAQAAQAAQPTPKAMIATMSEVDATRSIDDVSRGMP